MLHPVAAPSYCLKSLLAASHGDGITRVPARRAQGAFPHDVTSSCHFLSCWAQPSRQGRGDGSVGFASARPDARGVLPLSAGVRRANLSSHLAGPCPPDWLFPPGQELLRATPSTCWPHGSVRPGVMGVASWALTQAKWCSEWGLSAPAWPRDVLAQFTG